MKKRCLPACLILRNVALVLALAAGSVMLGADIHAAANHQQQNQALRRLFVYQILVGFEQQQQQ